MPLNTDRARRLLASADLQALFIEELGWDRHDAVLEVTLGDSSRALSAVAQKRGMVAYRCSTPKGQSLPHYPERRKIEHQVAKSTHEHLIVYTDGSNETQIWQWVKREPGRPVACREHTFHRSQSGDALLQKLASIAFTLAEEEELSLTDVTRRARAGFDVERVTKRFYELFQKEHAAFLKFIDGISDVIDREWYASVMLNRLMFVYFIQRKGFLDGDHDYLRNRLNRLRSEHGKDKFYSFYRYFLLRLFHEGLGGKERTPELASLVGRIPYLNGGLFDIHELENADRYGRTIQIPDKAFERLFDYFDRYHWHLDERPLRDDNEINPDVLGYIFEKYINQKQMGAYYTKEDITEYIGKSTVLPFLLNAARTECLVAFDNPKGPTVWDALREAPDRYIYSAVRHGLDKQLPAEVAGEFTPSTDSGSANRVESSLLRSNGSQPASAEFALPTETWRDVLARRRHCAGVKAKLIAGEVRDVNDLVSLNLDIRQFAQDIIENCEGPDLLRAFWRAIERVSILDPTCGSGAFLFAALNLLEPLYEGCLDRMEAFVADGLRSDTLPVKERYADFRKVLARVSSHPNRRYFIFKSIILNNLFGVDIMAEAVEICKLRLFLKLAAQVDPDSTKPNLGVEPLPDIDFNIRTGNTLVGYASLDEVKRALATKLDFDDASDKISRRAIDLQQAFDAFREQQIEGDGSVRAADKQALRMRLSALDAELTDYLAGECGVAPSRKDLYARWLKSHQPFHWFIEFHRIMEAGGFDVIIGNPPYVEIPKDLGRPLLRSMFKTALDKWSRDEDLYTLVVERSLRLLQPLSGQFGMILPLSLSFSTKQPFVALRKLLAREDGRWLWSHFDRIPSSLFGNEVRTRCTIAVLSRSTAMPGAAAATTPLLRWSAEYRECLFSTLYFSKLSLDISAGIPKVGSQRQADVLKQLYEADKPLSGDLRRSLPFSELVAEAPDFPQPSVFVGGTAYNWFPAWREIPETTNLYNEPSLPARTAGFLFQTEESADIVFALLCSSMGYWWWAVASDGFNLKKWLLERFPLSTAMIPVSARPEIARLGAALRRELREHYVYKDNKGRIGNWFLPACEEESLAIDACLGRSIPQLSPEFFADIQHFNASFSRADVLASETEEGEE